MLSFTYQLTGSGWALATIANERAEMKVPASYLCDALRDLVDSLQSLFVTDRSQCVWEEEPGEVRWDFQRDGRNITVRVYWYEDGGQSFLGDDDLLRFIGQVDRELDGLLAAWGDEGYLKKWHYPFPHEAHAKLKQGIQRESEHRRVAK